MSELKPPSSRPGPPGSEGEILPAPSGLPGVPDQVELYAGRIPLKGGRNLRQHTARGAVVNAAFYTSLGLLGFVKAFIVAGFLSPDDYGIWGILFSGLVTITFLMDVGIGDKYIQQTESDQVKAFQKAFTLHLCVTGIFLLLMLGALPLIALAYGRWEIIAPGLVMLTAMPATALLSPLWVYYRRMQFVQQRLLQGIDPIVSFVVTIALAAAGLGYWAFIIGSVAGIWCGVAMAIVHRPYPLRLRFDRRAVREYFGFSWPLFLANLNKLVLGQAAIFVGNWRSGLAAAGAITLATGISQFTNKADLVVTQTLYPAICAVKDRTELLFESFVKSNRLALMWGAPFGIGLALFTPDLVEFVLGERWEPAVELLQAFGLMAAVAQIGFNWDAFYRARGNTKPIAVLAVTSTLSYLAIAVPLLATEGLRGFVVGMSIVAALTLLVRCYYLTKLFDGLSMLRHGARALAPSVPAVAVVLAARLIESGERGAGIAAAEFVAYLGVTIGATLFFERALLREVVGYLRRVRPRQAVAAG